MRTTTKAASISGAGAAIGAADSSGRGMICRLQAIWFEAGRAFLLALAKLGLFALVAHAPAGARRARQRRPSSSGL